MSLALLAPTSSANFYEKVTLFGGTRMFPQSYTVEPFRPVRDHNVARVNKSRQSFGDRFATGVIDDLITSDLQAAVKGMN